MREGGRPELSRRRSQDWVDEAGMEGFQRFLVQPEALEEILANLEATRLRLYPQ